MNEPMNTIEFMYNKQGYIDLDLVSRMSGVPIIVVENILEQAEYIESNIKGQFIKKFESSGPDGRKVFYRSDDQ